MHSDRFVSLLFIYSHFLRQEVYPNFACRGYIGDEFFFIISGFYLAKKAINIHAEIDPIHWSIDYNFRKIKKIAKVYYLTWGLCFLGKQLTKLMMESNSVLSVFKDLLNSIYELLFLEMFGFNSGFYSNDVGWFFSGLTIVSFIITPLVVKYKEKFCLQVAPFASFFCYGALSLNFDYLYAPGYVVPNTLLLKGLVRALAGICLGVFSYSLSKYIYKQKNVVSFIVFWVAHSNCILPYAI